MPNLDFRVGREYESGLEGIIIPVHLLAAGREVELGARLDTGASSCLFDRSYADTLGLRVEDGVRQTYRTVMGTFTAYGHEVRIETFGLEDGWIVSDWGLSTTIKGF